MIRRRLSINHWRKDAAISFIQRRLNGNVGSNCFLESLLVFWKESEERAETGAFLLPSRNETPKNPESRAHSHFG